jgi:hypothetical protein
LRLPPHSLGVGGFTRNAENIEPQAEAGIEQPQGAGTRIKIGNGPK